MSLYSRRRALMAQGEQSDVLFEWNPSDGVSNINIIASSGSTHYVLNNDSIRLYALASWVAQRIEPKEAIDWAGDFTVEVSFKNVSGTNVNLYATSRLFDGLNGYVAFFTYTKKISVPNGTAVSVPSGATSGTLRLEIKRSTGAVHAYFIQNGIVVAETTGSVGTTHATRSICQVEGASATQYYDITHIVMRKGISA